MKGWMERLWNRAKHWGAGGRSRAPVPDPTDLPDATPVLEALGWTVETDEVGDRMASLSLGDRRVRVIYGYRSFPGHDVFEASLSASTDPFSTGCRTIHEDENAYAPLLVADRGIAVRVAPDGDRHVRQAADDAVSWARGIDLDAALSRLVHIPTTSPGARPIWHLAALAVSGHTATLESYLSAFEAGDRLGFVPYITKGHVERALRHAVKSVDGP